MDTPARAQFRCREQCIACQSRDLITLDSGTFSQNPVRHFIERDPWGVNPLPFLQDQPWALLQCAGCGQMFHKWLLTPQWQEIRFTQWMSEAAIREFERVRGHDSPRTQFRQATSIVKHLLQIDRLTRSGRGDGAVRLLDFGCGWGEVLGMARRFGFEACGVDRAADRYRVSSDQGARVFPDLQAASALAKEGFHAVTLFQVLEHIEEPLELLIELRHRMAPGAVLVLEVPNCRGLRGIAGIDAAADYYNLHPLDHINCFTPRSLTALARRAGFRPLTPPLAQVTADPWEALVGEGKRWARKLKPRSTNQYFRRAAEG
jgi:2-polyprenyl-3-methyl-5-hydroxy-6-metoxy-1,4-benzoquinol methylase